MEVLLKLHSFGYIIFNDAVLILRQMKSLDISPLRGFWFCVLLIAINIPPLRGDLLQNVALFCSEPHRGEMFIEKFNPKPHQPRRGEIMLLRKI